MRLHDLEKNNKPVLYIDMDGVLCDFFHAWATKHEDRADYNDMKDSMDAVEMEHSIQELAKSHKVEDFFADLDVLEGGVKIIEWAKSNNIPFTILSCPLRRPGEKSSIIGKKRWLTKHLGSGYDTVFRCDKYRMVDKSNNAAVLIDDFGKNIKEWEAAGGIGIKHEDENWTSTIQKLEQIYFPNRKQSPY